MSELSADQRRTFGESAPICEYTGEPIEIGFGALHPLEQAKRNLTKLNATWDALSARIASESVALGNLQRDVSAPRPPTPGFVFIKTSEADVLKQQATIVALVKEQTDLTTRIKTAREKLKGEITMSWTNHRPATVAEKNTFGPNCRISALTDRVLEDGFGALSDDEQEMQQLPGIEQERGKAAADAIRKKIADMKALKTAKAAVTTATAEAKADGLPVQ